MVKHIVMYKLKPFADGEDKKTNAIRMKKKLENLQNVVSGSFKLQVGINYNPGGYDVVLYSEFSDQETLDNYQLHPEHIRVREFIHEIIQDRVVADYMV